MKIFQSAEQNEQLARDAQAILDAEMRGIGFLVDGVSVHPSRVTVLRPQVVADERAAQRARVHAKVLAMPDSDMGNLIGPPMKCELPPEGWYCTRIPGHEGPCAALAAAPVQAQEPWIDKLSYDAQVDEWAIEKSNLEREIEELKSRAPVQPVAVPDGYEVSDNSETWNAIAAKVREEMATGMAILAAPAAQGDAKEDRAAQRERLNKKVLAMPDGMPNVIGPVLANTRCASCNSFNALHMTNCGYCGAAIAAKAAS